MPMPAPLLVLGWGNRSRGDDALGALFLDRLPDLLGADARARVECLEAHQLQIEHALDLVGRERVLFVDASADAAPPFEARSLVVAPAAGWAGHALAPAALLRVYRDLHGAEPPPATLLAIRGTDFALGAAPSAAAGAYLAQALAWGRRWVAGC